MATYYILDDNNKLYSVKEKGASSPLSSFNKATADEFCKLINDTGLGPCHVVEG